MQIKKCGTCVLMWEGDYLESLSYSERTDHHPDFFLLNVMREAIAETEIKEP